MKSQKGFTLIELVIYIALTAIVGGLFAGILVTTTRLQDKQTSSGSLVQELSFLMTTLERYIRSAENFSIDGNGSLTVLIDESTTPDTTKTIGVNEFGQATLSETDENGTVDSILSGNGIHIDNLTFTEKSLGESKSVHIAITASASTTNPQKQGAHSAESTVGLYMQAQ